MAVKISTLIKILEIQGIIFSIVARFLRLFGLDHPNYIFPIVKIFNDLIQLQDRCLFIFLLFGKNTSQYGTFGENELK